MLTHTLIARPQPDEYTAYYAKYINLVSDGDIVEILESQLDDAVAFLRTVPEAQAGVLHPPYTWTIRQVIGHLIDSERIFAYRALRIARGDTTPLPGFDENAFAQTGEFDRLPLQDLVSDFEIARRSTISLFGTMPESAWPRRGEANGNLVTVRALAWIIAGHTQHHMGIMRKRLTK